MNPARTGGEAEPAPAGGRISFEEGDFHALSEGLARDRQYDDRRLVTRRKLLALGKRAAARCAEEGVSLEVRTSLHHPHAFNQGRVRRLWAYLARAKPERRRLARVLGPELGRDLDAAYRNLYLCLAVEAEALEASLRIHPDAWFDGQNLKKRLARGGAPALQEWRALLNALPRGWRLRLHDWKGEWRCGELTTEALEDYLRTWTPGEHALAVELRVPAPPAARGPALGPEAADGLVTELLRLLPLYRFSAWSPDEDHLFA